MDTAHVDRRGLDRRLGVLALGAAQRRAYRPVTGRAAGEHDEVLSFLETFVRARMLDAEIDAVVSPAARHVTGKLAELVAQSSSGNVRPMLRPGPAPASPLGSPAVRPPPSPASALQRSLVSP